MPPTIETADLDWPPQTWLDRELQRQRIARVAPWIRDGGEVLDVGCGDGALFRHLGPRLARGVGLDPRLRRRYEDGTVTLAPGRFPQDAPTDALFDAITLTAVLEHLPAGDQAELARYARAHLRPGGRVVITVPSPAVDRILDVLMSLRLVGGMAVHEHYGFDARGTPALFPSPPFRQVAHRPFQLGLNHLFVFELEQRS